MTVEVRDEDSRAVEVDDGGFFTVTGLPVTFVRLRTGDDDGVVHPLTDCSQSEPV